jgi:hypothetical protein
VAGRGAVVRRAEPIRGLADLREAFLAALGRAFADFLVARLTFFTAFFALALADFAPLAALAFVDPAFLALPFELLVVAIHTLL